MSNPIYVLTNRTINERRKGLSLFGKVPSEKGPNELRVVEVTRQANGRYRARALGDRLDKRTVKRLAEENDLALDPAEPHFASLRVACDIFARSRQEGKAVLLYVHGYNNDIGDVLKTCERLEALYNVIVVPFSWPANGGGYVSGRAVYLSDKADARASADALNQAIRKFSSYFRLLTEQTLTKLEARAGRRHADNRMAGQIAYTELIKRTCDLSLNLLCHSMGNYVLKYALMPGSGASRDLVFDNVSLVAADANNPHHADWVRKIQVRKRLLIVINEEDYALTMSRIKPGHEQKERLGQHLLGLTAGNAHYVNLTDAPGVGNQHSYFIEETAGSMDERVRAFFQSAFTGEAAERGLTYRPSGNFYVV